MMRVQSSSGFSVLELCVVLILVSVLAGASAPTMSRVIQDFEWRMATHRLLGVIRFTRLNAVAHHRSAALCARDDGADWSSGWQVRDGVTRKIYQTYAPLSSRFQLTWRGGFSSRQCVVFDAQGFASGSQGRFVLSSVRYHHPVDVIVGRGGDVRLVR